MGDATLKRGMMFHLISKIMSSRTQTRDLPSMQREKWSASGGYSLRAEMGDAGSGSGMTSEINGTNLYTHRLRSATALPSREDLHSE
jgi:hypothetical protein